MSQSIDISHKRIWRFRVKYEEQFGQLVCITGDCSTLGNWTTNNIIKLEKTENVWSVSVEIPTEQDVHYRYYICYVDDTSKFMIHSWETNMVARIAENDEQIDIYGIYDGTCKIERGWIITETAVHMRLNCTSIRWFYPDYKKVLLLKISSVPPCHSMQGSKLRETLPLIYISLSNESGQFREQDETGYSFGDVREASFFTKVFSLDVTTFMFKISVTSQDGSYDEYVSFITLSCLATDSSGALSSPIFSRNQEYTGILTVKFLIVRPCENLNNSFRSSYAKYWNSGWTGLQIGHRGLGQSFTTDDTNSEIRENTIGSFRAARNYGAHWVEFDVQLTKDLVPIIYHDFHVLLDVNDKTEDCLKKLIVPLHDLSLNQLKNFKVRNIKENDNEWTFKNDSEDDYSPFPLLEKVLRSLDQNIGLNIEIKYNAVLLSGSNEVDNSIDMNVYVDKILQVVYAKAGARYIVLSSFNPDICMMVRLKQNKYPVMFLTQGITERYEPYLDDRMNKLESAINFANSADLLGIVAHSEDLLRDDRLIELVFKNNLILFCWGDDNNNEKTVAWMKQRGVHGIIFDRMDRYGVKSDDIIQKSFVMKQ